jgi:hypothetical protein
MTTPTSQPSDPSTTAQAVSPDQLFQVLGIGAVTEECLRDEVQTLKRELSQESQEVADDRLMKRIRLELEKGPATVRDKMEEATSALQQTPSTVKKAKTSPAEGMTSMVDASEFVWYAVEEYNLVDGEDDDNIFLFRSKNLLS